MSFSLAKTPRQKFKLDLSPSPRKSAIKEHRIHNEDKLKVFIKFRPPSPTGHNKKNTCVTYLSEKQLEVETSLNRKIYTFDHVFDPQVDPQSLFRVGCSDLIEEVIEGVHADKPHNNGLVFVYGNTGTGKTHTMGLINQINQNSMGIAPDAIRHIFQDNGTVEEACVSFCEIYKDEVYDLLDFAEDKKLNIRQNQKSREPFIEDLIMIQVKNFKQASQLLNIGLQKRRIAEQKVNNRSSRGHGVITFYLKNRNSNNTGRISLVDLAGCERIKQSESKGATLNEALFINTSLSALETLLMNISDQNVRSYRSNKLTRLLQPYFEFGKIRLFVTSNYESSQSIEFAKRCKGIKFHEREVRLESDRPLRTPRKGEKEDGKIKDKIEQMKKELMSRQKEYLKCISNLVSIIRKMYETISSSVCKQSIHSSFSLPELFQHLPLESKVNAKINIFEKKEEEILHEEGEDSFSKLESQMSANISLISTSISAISTNISAILSDNFLNEEVHSVFQKTQEIMRNSQEVGFLGIKKMTQLSQLADYKNVYKKEWFTSEIKNGLLENKNEQFEKGIVYLMDQFNKFMSQVAGGGQIQARINKKLKEMGILLAEERSAGKESLMRKSSTDGRMGTEKMKTVDTEKMKIVRKESVRNRTDEGVLHESNENSQQAINKSRKRSIIFIDED